MAQQALRTEQECAVAVLAIFVLHRRRAGAEPDAMALGDLRAQRLPARQQRLDAGDGRGQVAALGRRQLAGQGHRRVLGQQHQLRIGGRGLGHMGVQVRGVVVPAFEQLDRVLAGCEADHAVSAFSQNDIGFAVLSLWPTSRQVNDVLNSG